MTSVERAVEKQEQKEQDAESKHQANKWGIAALYMVIAFLQQLTSDSTVREWLNPLVLALFIAGMQALLVLKGLIEPIFGQKRNDQSARKSDVNIVSDDVAVKSENVSVNKDETGETG